MGSRGSATGGNKHPVGTTPETREPPAFISQVSAANGSDDYKLED